MIKGKSEIRKIEELREWDKNPRSITKEDFERLKKQIKELGVYKPLIINQDNIVLGGNMRLKALRELGVKEVWVSVVETKNEEEMMKYNLSDNDRAGFYDPDLFSSIEPQFNINWSDYSVDFLKPVNLEKVINNEINFDFDDIEGNEDREKNFKDILVTCPHCQKSFNIKV